MNDHTIQTVMTEINKSLAYLPLRRARVGRLPDAVMLEWRGADGETHTVTFGDRGAWRAWRERQLRPFSQQGGPR